MQTTQVKILYAILAVLVIGQGFTLYKLLRVPSTSDVAANQAADVANQSSLAGVVIGGSDVSAGSSVGGTVMEVGSGILQVKDDKGSTDNFTTSAGTKVQLLGTYKDIATQQSELAAYNAQVAELLKDPQGNKAALAALHQPLAREVTAGTVADLKVGDSVAVFTDGTSNAATQINISTNVPPPANY